MTNNKSQIRGFTLVELMIGLVLAMLLVLGLTQVFSASRNAYQTSTGLSRVQEGSRAAMDFMQRDLRMAGHLGCISDVARFLNELPGEYPAIDLLMLTHAQRTAQNYAAAPWGLRFNVAIEGFEATGTAPGNAVNLGALPAATWTPALNANGANLDTLAPAARAGSDIVVLRFLSSEGVSVVAANTVTNPATITIPAANAGFVTAGSMYGIANCSASNPGAAVFRSTTAADAGGAFTVAVGGGATGNVAGFLGAGGFGPGSSVYQAEIFAYYVGINPAGVPALYRARLTNVGGWNSEELVEGVEMLQILYGVDNGTGGLPDGNVDVFAPADATVAGFAVAAQPARWRQVGAVRVGVLMRSPERSASQRNEADVAIGQISVAGVTITVPATDTSLRQSYETTIALRNRLFGN